MAGVMIYGVDLMRLRLDAITIRNEGVIPGALDDFCARVSVLAEALIAAEPADDALVSTRDVIGKAHERRTEALRRLVHWFGWYPDMVPNLGLRDVAERVHEDRFYAMKALGNDCPDRWAPFERRDV